MRARNAAATREAILNSALEAFTRAGYDGVGVREIAESAGVTAMLVNRYFGSKEGLFAEVVEAAMAERTVLTDDPATLAADLAASLVRRTAPDAGRLDPFLLMLRSAPNPRAAEILRAGIERHVEKHLADRLQGRKDAGPALVLSVIAGFWVMRTLIGSTALGGADEAVLKNKLERVFAVLLAE
ncbi:TetR/AcrR family transcriptional regulator [Amycolatopsis sp. SID8362]|uniref:TetR/AcrR family transcriptional regulator n=1 Tax=Amycolatopsis sp. SID8362 TaxID=2690346 RepID=UPI00136DE039|nr:TetR/AcrR family transcriptional regulator [Amycolatopsis sp. SID8362]NBH04644.1 TetR family transcriptional regulator [Amycolatopsis sp. SID8362]NED41344.1 TetR/AcrR family transcriptional regulator [Amycolatopsis sp. SID8362]